MLSNMYNFLLVMIFFVTIIVPMYFFGFAINIFDLITFEICLTL